MGGTGNYPIRYPYDPYDRGWLPWSDSKVWSDISTKEKIQGNVWNLRYHAPSAVLQTAITALSGSKSKTIEVSFATQLDNVNPMLGCIAILYIVELQILSGNLVHEFNVTLDGGRSKLQHRLEYLVPDVIYNSEPHECSSWYNITMKAAANSTLPPILNALEYFSVISTANVGTVIQDGINVICFFRDLTGNQLNGSIPSGLLKRSQDGSLTLRYGKNPNLCDNNSSCQPTGKKKNHMLAVYIAVPIAAVLVIGALIALLIFRVRKKKGPTRASNGHGHQQLDNCRFTYKELQVMTDNFKIVLGQGGFGPVYDGFLQNGTHVAVKILSQSSNQGIREFLTEVMSSQV
ncbi:hypothetical protein ACQ4PT_045840 [Festuca glaucescens]